jgi:Flp pilus assembly protein TadD
MSYTNLGTAFMANDQLMDAEAAYRKAIELDETNAQAHYDLALLLESVEEDKAIEEALSHLDEAARLQPGFWKPYNDMGRIFATNEKALDIQKAIDILHMAQSMAGDAPEPHLNLAVAHVRRKDYASAKRHLDIIMAMPELRPFIKEQAESLVTRLK